MKSGSKPGLREDLSSVSVQSKRSASGRFGSRLQGQRGFTIVETMIVLAVSSTILVASLTLVNGTQSKTEFKQAINNINDQISSIEDNVAQGYYSTNLASLNKTCQASSPPVVEPTFIAGGGERGTSGACVFLGRVIQFTDNQNYYVHNVVGLRVNGTPPAEVTNMASTAAIILDKGTATHNYANMPTTTGVQQLRNGLTVAWVKYKQGGAWTGSTDGMAFMSSLGVVGTNTSDFQSGANSIDFGPIIFNSNPTLSGVSSSDFIDSFDNATNGFAANFDAIKNPSSGVAICFSSATTSQYGLITVGGSGRQGTSTKLQIGNGDCGAATSLLP